MAALTKKNSPTNVGLVTKSIVGFLIVLFSALSFGPLTHALANFLPTETVQVTLKERGKRRSSYIAARGSASQGVSYYLVVREGDVDSNLDCPKKAYESALISMNRPETIGLQRTRFLGTPVAIFLPTLPLLSGASQVVKKEEKRYSLLMPLTGAIMAFGLCFSLLGYMLWKWPEGPRKMMPLFLCSLLMGFAIGFFAWS